MGHQKESKQISVMYSSYYEHKGVLELHIRVQKSILQYGNVVISILFILKKK